MEKRSVITIISTGMTLVLTGLANGFRVIRHTVDSMGVDVFVVRSGAAGPFWVQYVSDADLPEWPLN